MKVKMFIKNTIDGTKSQTYSKLIFNEAQINHRRKKKDFYSRLQIIDTVLSGNKKKN